MYPLEAMRSKQVLPRTALTNFMFDFVVTNGGSGTGSGNAGTGTGVAGRKEHDDEDEDEAAAEVGVGKLMSGPASALVATCF